MSFTVIGIYRPLSAKAVFYEKLDALIKGCDTNKEIILLGDFNINWNDEVQRKKLKITTGHYDFRQIIEGPTRLTRSPETCIDLAFTNRPERIKKRYNLVTGLSDHNMILIVRKLTKSRFNLTSDKRVEKYKIPKSQLDNKKQKKTTVNEIDWDDYLTYEGVDQNCIFFD